MIGWKAPLEGGVLLMCFRTRRASSRDGVELTAREHRLSRFDGVHRALGTHRRRRPVWSSSMNRMTEPPASLIPSAGLQALLDSPGTFAPAMMAPRSERDDALVLERLRDVAADDPLARPSR